MEYKIKNRFTGKVQFAAEIECPAKTAVSIKIGLAVKWALKAGADLAGADLAHANLAGAFLAGANLAHANLADANLADANLAGAFLAGADLAHANLAHAFLADANLAHANLADANLADANLAHANLAHANLAHAFLADADFARALKIDEKDIPVIPKIDAVILAEIEKGGTLDMGSWHGPQGWCGTTHCRAGWAVHCAGKPGRALEEKLGTRRAAALIYRASRPGISAPWFFAPTKKALADIKKSAAEQSR